MSISISHLTKTFLQGASEISILQDLNLEVKKGEVVGIIGQSGSGKSTMLSLISGLDRPSKGNISINQQSVDQFSEDQWAQFRAKNIGIVFQQYHLVPHLTALENVTIAAEISGQSGSEALKNATALLNEMDLSHRLDHLPGKLSGGECQRVAIARALVTKPSLCLADEPSGNLDFETGEKVMRYFFSAIKKYQTSTLLVTHNIEIAKGCDRVLLLKNGKLIPA